MRPRRSNAATRSGTPANAPVRTKPRKRRKAAARVGDPPSAARILQVRERHAGRRAPDERRENEQDERGEEEERRERSEGGRREAQVEDEGRRPRARRPRRARGSGGPRGPRRRGARTRPPSGRRPPPRARARPPEAGRGAPRPGAPSSAGARAAAPERRAAERPRPRPPAPAAGSRRRRRRGPAYGRASAFSRAPDRGREDARRGGRAAVRPFCGTRPQGRTARCLMKIFERRSVAPRGYFRANRRRRWASASPGRSSVASLREAWALAMLPACRAWIELLT